MEILRHLYPIPRHLNLQSWLVDAAISQVKRLLNTE